MLQVRRECARRASARASAAARADFRARKAERRQLPRPLASLSTPIGPQNVLNLRTCSRATLPIRRAGQARGRAVLAAFGYRLGELDCVESVCNGQASLGRQFVCADGSIARSQGCSKLSSRARLQLSASLIVSLCRGRDGGIASSYRDGEQQLLHTHLTSVSQWLYCLARRGVAGNESMTATNRSQPLCEGWDRACFTSSLSTSLRPRLLVSDRRSSYHVQMSRFSECIVARAEPVELAA